MPTAPETLSSLLAMKRLRGMVTWRAKKEAHFLFPDGPTGRRGHRRQQGRQACSPWETGRRLPGGRCSGMASS